MTLLDHKQCTPSSVQHGYISLSSAAQRSAVPCLALRFARLCRAALCVLLNIRQQFLLLLVVEVPGKVQIQILYQVYVRTCFVYSSFCFLQMIVLSRSPCAPPPRKYRTYCRSERDIDKHTAQRRTIISSAPQAPLSLGHYYQIAIRTK